MSKVKLGDVAVEVRETTKQSERMPIVGLEHLTSGDLQLSQWSEENENTFTKVFHQGQILFGRRRAYLKKAAVAPFDGVCSGDITVIAAKPERIHPRLLPFIIGDDRFFDYAMEKSAGSLSPRVKWAQLAEYEFDLPDMDKQHQLVALLWAMERTKKAYQNLLAQTDELVKSQFIEMFGDPLNNDNGWEVESFSRLCTAIGDGLHGTPVYDDNGPYPFINGNNFRVNKIVITPETRKVGQEMYEKHYIELDETTVMLSINGTLGKTALYRGESVILGKSACYAKVGPRLNREFVLALFLSDSFQQYIQDNCTGTTIKNFGLKALREYPMIVPPIEKQIRFVDFMRQSDKSKLEIQQALDSLEKSRNAIMKKVFG